MGKGIRYSDEFKQEAVNQVVIHGYLVADVADAQDYERIHRQHLSNFPNVSRIRSNFTLRTVSKKTALIF